MLTGSEASQLVATTAAVVGSVYKVEGSMEAEGLLQAKGLVEGKELAGGEKFAACEEFASGGDTSRCRVQVIECLLLKRDVLR